MNKLSDSASETDADAAAALMEKLQTTTVTHLDHEEQVTESALADDQALVRGALAALLDLETDIEVVAQVGRGDEVAAAARSSQVEVCLLDIEMPGLTGLEVAEQLRAELPAVRSLIVTTFGRPGYVRRALDAGAAGFLVKDTPARELADAVRRVHAGLRVVDPDLATESLMSGPSPLTTRESEILLLAIDGSPVAVIAARPTLRRHRPQPPLGRDRQDGRVDPGRSGAARPVERVDLIRSNRHRCALAESF